MGYRLGILVCLTTVAFVSAATVVPRLQHTFPSMVDDWKAIEAAPEQLDAVVRLGNPEEQRYRPGFVAWNTLQWHTLGAPKELVGPQLWGALRWLVLVLGLTLLAAALVTRVDAIRALSDVRWLLVAGVPLIVITAPALAVDLARFGPQEPLLVGCSALGAVLLIHALDRFLEPIAWRTLDLGAAVLGLGLWAFGALQKESSVCLILLAPFLLPTLRRQRGRWRRVGAGRRVAIGLVAGGIALPFLPMVANTIDLALADDRVYAEAAAGRGLLDRLSAQLGEAAEVLHTPLPTIVLAAAAVAVAIRCFREVDWLAVGLLVAALGFIVFAAEAGVVASRYYLPPLALGALALARSVASLGSPAALATGLALCAGGAWQAWDAHSWVEGWVDGERDQETLVREAAGRAAAGCGVRATGLNTELVLALPVLMPLAQEPPRECRPGQRFVVVIDAGGPGTVTAPDDPTLVACAPAPTPVWRSHVGKIERCTA